MATVKVNQPSIDELKSAITFSAEQASQAAELVAKAVNGISGMSFAAKPGLESDLTSLKNRLNKQAQLGRSCCRAVQETVDLIVQVDNLAVTSSEAAWSRTRAQTVTSPVYTAAALMSLIVKEQLRRQSEINDGFIDGTSGAGVATTPSIDRENSESGTTGAGGNSAGQARTAAIVNGATAHLGQAYVSGGEGTSGYDCIGLVREAYRKAGIDLPRQATGNGTSNWAVQGLVEDVTGQTGSPAPGDILCWYKDTNNKTGQPDHVAIYTGPIQTNIKSGTYQGYQTDAEGYIISSGARVDCINALSPGMGVCYIKSDWYSYDGISSAAPTDIWRAP